MPSSSSSSRAVARLGVVALATMTAGVSATTYPSLRNYAGNNFFSLFTFSGGYDNTTSGDVNWVSNSSLAYIDAGSNQAIIKVDNTTTLPYNEKRDSVKLFSNDWFKPGVVMVMDLAHIPTGCSVWPAWWTTGRTDIAQWPTYGEIDIIETINNESGDKFSLHTTEGCTATVNSTLGMSGSYQQPTNCQSNFSMAAGCISTPSDSNSAGAEFNANGGGVYAMEFALSGINFWFIPRSSVPSGLTANLNSLDTSTLGTPSASYSASTCNIASHFGSQQMVLDTTLCGVDAGYNLQGSCGNGNLAPNGQSCYQYWVAGAPSNFDQAYWAINYIQVFGESSAIDTSLSKSSSTSASASSSATSTRGSSQGASSAKATGTTTAGAASASASKSTSGSVSSFDFSGALALGALILSATLI